jgi:hypothetical protein
MNHSQQELNDLCQSLKGKPSSDYDEARLTDGDLIQQLQIDVLMADGTSKAITYTRRRENLEVEWGLWEPGFSGSIAVD